MGLLDNFRRQVTDEPVADETEDRSADSVATELPAGVPDDDPWLAGIDRRRPGPETLDQAFETPGEAETLPGELFAQSSSSEQVAFVGAEFGGSFTPVDPVEDTPSPAMLPDLGMVYAGLSSEGVTSLDDLPVGADGAFDGETTAPVVDGPDSPDAEPHLAVLGLHPGVSWDDIRQVRRQELAANPSTGTAEQLQRRLEVNHASAALRLLYVR